MATVAIGACRHTRRVDTDLSQVYAFMDKAINEQFGPDHFVTAQMMCLNVATGRMQWVNAGHPAPPLIRDRVVLDRLESPNLAGRIRRGAADSQRADPGTRGPVAVLHRRPGRGTPNRRETVR